MLEYAGETAAGIAPGTAAKIEGRISEWISSAYTPMAQYMAMRNGKVFLSGAQGAVDPDEQGRALDESSIFPVSSITKTFTGAVIMMLTDDGILSPTDFVYRHIPEFDGEGKNRVTIGHLLTHTSGIDDNLRRFTDEELKEIAYPKGEPESAGKFDKYMYAACHLPNKCDPGVSMSYSSTGINIVGEIISRATGMPYREVVKTRLFEPLGMVNTFMGVPKSELHRVVSFPENAYFGGGVWDTDRVSASGGAFSNAHDLCIFAQMLLNKGEFGGRRILSRLAVEAMTKNQIPGISAVHDGVRFREAGWGFSLMLSLDKFDETGTLRSPESYGHSGAGCSMFLVDPVNEVVAALLYCTMKKDGDDHFERRFDRFFNMVLSGVSA